MQTKHLCVLIHIWTKGDVGAVKPGLNPPVKYFTGRSKAVLVCGSFMFFSVLCLLCLCTCLFICALWSPSGKGLTSWLSFVVSNCEFVTFPLVSRVRCGTWLYRFLIFAPLLTMALISAGVKILLCIVVLKQGLIRYKNIPLCWSGPYTRALEKQEDIRPTFTHSGGGSGYG